MKYATSIYLASWNMVCFAMIALAWAYGLIQGVFIHDASHVTVIVATLMALVIGVTTYQTFRLDSGGDRSSKELAGMTAFVLFIKSEVIVILAICGTLLGIYMVTSASASMDASPEGTAARIALLNTGLHTGVGASLVGLICKLWCEVLFFLKSKRLRQLGWL